MLYDSLKLHVKLRNLREIHNMTREELADKLQLSIKSISDIETGKTNITVKRLVDYCNIFNCNLEDILNFNVSQMNLQQNSGQKVKPHISVLLVFQIL